jgi:hypothetical protein
MSFSNKPAANVASEKASTSRYKDAVKLGRAGGGVGHVVGDSHRICGAEFRSECFHRLFK